MWLLLHMQRNQISMHAIEQRDVTAYLCTDVTFSYGGSKKNSQYPKHRYDSLRIPRSRHYYSILPSIMYPEKNERLCGWLRATSSLTPHLDTLDAEASLGGSPPSRSPLGGSIPKLTLSRRAFIAPGFVPKFVPKIKVSCRIRSFCRNC